MINRETDYAIRAIKYLSENNNCRYISTTELSEEMEIPYRFLRKIVKKLTESELVYSRKGSSGGLKLLKSPAEITLLQVINAIEPNSVKLNLCMVDKENCSRTDSCPIYTYLRSLQDKLDMDLARKTFEN